MLLFLISLLAGALTAFAPCVLPLLPVIVGGSISGDEKDRSRPYVITASLAVSLIIFTYLLKITSVLINIPQNTWTIISGLIVIGLGAVSLFPNIWENLVARFGLQQTADSALKKGVFRSGPVGAIITGAALGPIFSSCSPTYAFVLATVLPRDFGVGLRDLVAFIIGLSVVLLGVCLTGRKYLQRFSWAIDAHSKFRRGLGVFFIIIGVSIGFGYDTKAELWITNHTPVNVTKLDQKLLGNVVKSAPKTSTVSALNVQPFAEPELTGISGWINSKPLLLSQLHGKVVLVDFWTYSCINCIRSVPYVEKWYKNYKDKGLVVIGIEAPEFSFEKVPSNVQAAVKQRGITYPVAIDANLQTWNAFNNEYWPADYLINKSGQVVGESFGEGGYDQTEVGIQSLLGIRAPIVTDAGNAKFERNETQETYFGSDRMSGYAGKSSYTNGLAQYLPTTNLSSGQWDLTGAWDIHSDKIVSGSDTSVLRFHVTAKDVYLVSDVPSGVKATIKVSLQGSGAQFTEDDPSGLFNASMSNLYHLASLPTFGDTTVTLTVPKGVGLNTFTFGG